MPSRPLEPARDHEIAALLKDVACARRHTDELFTRVPDALMFECPIAERHRLAFYLGHLEAFDVNLLMRQIGRPRLVDPLDRLFAFGIDPTDGDLPHDRPDDWPPLAEIRAYARRTRARIDVWLSQAYRRRHDDALITRLQAAIEHRWMHAETLAYLLNRLPIERTVRAVSAMNREPDTETVAVETGEVLMGNRSGFG